MPNERAKRPIRTFIVSTGTPYRTKPGDPGHRTIPRAVRQRRRAIRELKRISLRARGRRQQEVNA